MTNAVRLARLARAQRALARAAQADHAATSAALAVEQSERAAILAALNRDGPIHGAVVSSMATVLRASGQRAERLSWEAEEAAQKAAHQDVAARILTRKADVAHRRDARKDERRRLDLLAATATVRNRGPASF